MAVYGVLVQKIQLHVQSHSLLQKVQLTLQSIYRNLMRLEDYSYLKRLLNALYCEFLYIMMHLTNIDMNNTLEVGARATLLIDITSPTV